MTRIWSIVCLVAFAFGFVVHPALSQEKAPELDPAFAAWYYPKAESPGSALIEGRLHQTLLITSDDVLKIENFYRKLANNPSGERKADDEPPPFGIHTSLGYPHPKDKSKYVTAIWGDDSETKLDGEPRGVTIRTLVYST